MEGNEGRRFKESKMEGRRMERCMRSAGYERRYRFAYRTAINGSTIN